MLKQLSLSSPRRHLEDMIDDDMMVKVKSQSCEFISCSMIIIIIIIVKLNFRICSEKKLARFIVSLVIKLSVEITVQDNLTAWLEEQDQDQEQNGIQSNNDS